MRASVVRRALFGGKGRLSRAKEASGCYRCCSFSSSSNDDDAIFVAPPMPMRQQSRRSDANADADDGEDGRRLRQLSGRRRATEDATADEAEEKVDIREAVKTAKRVLARSTTFPETVEIAIRLGVNPKRSDMTVRGVVNLPHGTGKRREKKVIVFCEDEETRDKAKRVWGADESGGDDLIEAVREGRLNVNDVSVCVATPEAMPRLKTIARILGPKGLMPNPKTGTLTTDVEVAVKEAKSGGRVEYRTEKNAIVHAGIGKVTFEDEMIVENATSLMASLLRNRPKGKGAPSYSNYVKRISLSTTMSKGSCRVDARSFVKMGEQFNSKIEQGKKNEQLVS